MKTQQKIPRRRAGAAAIILGAALLPGLLAGCAASGDGALTTVRLSEVTHSVLYAPQYVAIELGFFAEEGIEIELVTGEGADKVMTAVVSGAVDIGFSGPEAAIYVYNEGRDDHAVVFGQVVKRDGAFLLAREPSPDFEWSEMRGAHLLPGRKGGVPYMALEYAMKQNGLVPGTDVEMDSSVQYAAMTGAFLGGTGDYVTAYEPTASTIEQEGKGYIVASVGAAAGEMPCTCYYALGSYIAENEDLIQRFTNALYKGQKWVTEHTAEEIAQAVAPSFPDADLAIMTKAIARYKEIDAYNPVPILEEESFDRLQLVMSEAGELATLVPYAELIDNSFGEAAIAAVDG